MRGFPDRRRKSRPFVAGDVVDVMVTKGLDPNGGWSRATIEHNASSQFGKGMFMVRFEEDGRLDHVHELRFALVEAAGAALTMQHVERGKEFLRQQDR